MNLYPDGVFFGALMLFALIIGLLIVSKINQKKINWKRVLPWTAVIIFVGVSICLLISDMYRAKVNAPPEITKQASETSAHSPLAKIAVVISVILLVVIIVRWLQSKTSPSSITDSHAANDRYLNNGG